MELQLANIQAKEGIKLEDGTLAVIQGVRWSSTVNGDYATVVMLAEKDDPDEPLSVIVMDAQIDTSEDGLTKELSMPGVLTSEEAVATIQARLENCRTELLEQIRTTSKRSHSTIVDRRAQAKKRATKKKKDESDREEFAFAAIMKEYDCTKAEAKKIFLKDAKRQLGESTEGI